MKDHHTFQTASLYWANHTNSFPWSELDVLGPEMTWKPPAEKAAKCIVKNNIWEITDELNIKWPPLI